MMDQEKKSKKSKKAKKKSKDLKTLIEKGWRTKHKNVIDPVFLAEVEHVIQDIASIQFESKVSR
jgi:hypothetical protein